MCTYILVRSRVRSTLRSKRQVFFFNFMPFHVSPMSSLPTSPFTILEPQYPWIDEFYVVQERRVTDCKAPKCEMAGRAHNASNIYEYIFERLSHVILFSKELTCWLGRLSIVSTLFFFTFWTAVKYFIFIIKFQEKFRDRRIWNFVTDPFTSYTKAFKEERLF